MTSRKRLATLVLSTALVAASPAGAAHAAGADAPPVRAAAAPAPKVVVFTIADRQVAVTPGAKIQHKFEYGNAAKKKQTVWAFHGGYCIGARPGEGGEFGWTRQKVTVPPSGGNPRVVRLATVTVPKHCSATENGVLTVRLSTTPNIKDAYSSNGPTTDATKPLTVKNARHNLQEVRVVPNGGKAKDYAVLHTLPKKHEAWFRARGIVNIHQSQHLEWWCRKPKVRTRYAAKVKAYDKAWATYRKKRPRATATQIWLKRDALVKKYEMRCP